MTARWGGRGRRSTTGGAATGDYGQGIATSDFGPGFRYVMGTVPREGVKTVNKKDLPKE